MNAFLLSMSALLVVACGSSVNNSRTSVGANRGNLTASNTQFNADTYARSENAYTTAGNSSLGTLLKPSVGKTVSEIRLWQNKEIDIRLKKLMGSDYRTMKRFWKIETPIKKFGGYLMMTGCEQHNCGDNRYVIFIDTSEGNINVVHIENGNTKIWKEFDGIDLPPPFVDELAAMTSKN